MVKNNKKIINIEKEVDSLIKEKERYVKDNLFDKALDLCLKIKEKEEELKALKNNSKTVISREDILKVIEDKSNIPMFLKKEELVDKIKESLDKKIFYQEEALKKLVSNLKLYFKMENNLKILLVGPSGVGKTSSVKVISEELKTNLIRLDMSEYNLETSVNKLIGVSQGYVGYDDDFIFNKVKYNPYSIILVDEIEKAHPAVLNLFLQIMDEGVIHDAHGELIDFSHTMIFMTSNAYKNKKVGFLDNKNKLNEAFSEEFLGRFDEIIDFKNLERDEVLGYVKEKLNNREVDYEKILEEINYEAYGFRYVNKVINRYNLKINN